MCSELERLRPGDEMCGVARQYQAKLLAMLTAIAAAKNVAQLATVPGWRVLSRTTAKGSQRLRAADDAAQGRKRHNR